MKSRFEAFLVAYGSDQGTSEPSEPIPRQPLIEEIPGFTELLERLGGMPLKGGIYRLFGARLFDAAMEFVRDAFPAWSSSLAPFGCDWMGRIFAVERTERRGPDGERTASLLDPATRDLLEVPATVTEFHNKILIANPEIALEESLWKSWLAGPGRPLSHDEIVGWRVPGFLGGELVLENLEIQNAGVYWGISGQLIAKTFKLKEGTRIKSVEIE